MGISDTSYLIRMPGKSYDEELTYKENSFLLKKAYQYISQCLHCFTLYRMMDPIYAKNPQSLMKIMRKMRFIMNMFIERINSFKSR
jgi:hypothetical protein